MKVMYDPRRDGLRILFSDSPIERTSDETGGLILDYDGTGAVVGLELTQASRRMRDPRRVEFVECAPPSGGGAAAEEMTDPRQV